MANDAQRQTSGTHRGPFSHEVEAVSDLLEVTPDLRITELDRAVRSILPVGLALEIGSIAEIEPAPFASELVLISGAVAKRRQEFHAGRTYARRALASLGESPAPILRNAGRGPVWPKGIVGSISHTGELCGAVVTRNSDWATVGLDLEIEQELAPEISQMVCSPRELARAALIMQRSSAQAAMALFSIKESVYKAYWPIAGEFLDFTDVEIAVTGSGRFAAMIKNPSRPAMHGLRTISGFYGNAGGAWFSLSALPHIGSPMVSVRETGVG